MKYELMLILDAKQTDKELDKVLSEVKDGLAEHGYSVLDQDIWGNRELAYKIKGRSTGYYVVQHFTGEPEGLNGFKRDLNLINGVLRTLVQKVADDAVLLRYEELKTTKAGDAGVQLSQHAEELSKKVTRKGKSEEEDTSEEDKEKLDEQIKAILDDQDIDV